MTLKIVDVINNTEKQFQVSFAKGAHINSFGKTVLIGDCIAGVFGLSDAQGRKTVNFFYGIGGVAPNF